MQPEVVITNWVHESVLDRLGGEFKLTANRTKQPWPSDVLAGHIGRADALMTFMPDSIDKEVLSGAPNLKLVACALKGYDNFDVAACSDRGVAVTIVEDLLTEPAAELAVGMMIALGRSVLPADNYVRQGRFRGWRPLFYGSGLAGSTVGLLGFGAIGRSLAARLSGFGARVLYWDAYRADSATEASLRVSFVDRDQLVASSDFLVLALSLSRETRHFLDSVQISKMKPGAIIVNIARGSLVDEAAVAAALSDGHLGGYAADVFEFEDWALDDRPRDIAPELLKSDRTLLTPHIGSAVDAVRERIAMEAAESIIDFFAGRTPTGLMNPQVMRTGTS